MAPGSLFCSRRLRDQAFADLADVLLARVAGLLARAAGLRARAAGLAVDLVVLFAAARPVVFLATVRFALPAVVFDAVLLAPAAFLEVVARLAVLVPFFAAPLVVDLLPVGDFAIAMSFRALLRAWEPHLLTGLRNH